MANVDKPLSERLTERPNAGPDPALVYETNAEGLYTVIRNFLPDSAAAELLEALAAELLTVVPAAGYEQYSNLLSLKIVYALLSRDVRVKIPKPGPLAENQNGFSFSEAFSLLLRDRLALSCFEIAAVIGISEGSVRTRLERARARVFSTETTASAASRKPTDQHLCIKTRELIEDWNVITGRLGQFSVPATVAKAIGDCERCEQVLQQRLRSLAYFQELHLPSLPDRLKTFPVSPLFVKEGKRMLLNWSAAPWYLKALFEGLLATTLVLGIVLSIPRVRSLYDFWLEKRLDLYSIAELAANFSGRSESQPEPSPQPTVITAQAAPQPADAAQKDTAPAPGSRNERLAVKPETEFGGREEIPSADKIYRVLIKNDAPETMKEQVLRILTNLKYVPADEESKAGADLPGGVMFDVFVPLKAYKPLMNELAKFGQMRPIITRAKERGMAGKAHFKIWLQRI